MFLVAGLGNPDSGYALNRHNAGFVAADEIVRRHKFSDYKNKFDAKSSQGDISENQVLVLKPQTFMNLSGNSVSKAARFYKIDINNIIIIHDDLDLDVGKIKVKQGGGNGGHNGLKSIDACLGNSNYIRIRIGIGRPQYSSMVTNYVLSDFTKEEQEKINNAVSVIAENIDILLNQNITNFMNKITAKTKKQTPPKTNKTDSNNLINLQKTKEIVEEKTIMKTAFEKALSLITKKTEVD